jgi:hypothetical protein
MTEPFRSSQDVHHPSSTHRFRDAEDLPFSRHQFRETLPVQSTPATPDGGVDAGPCYPGTTVPNDISCFLDASQPQPFPLPSVLPQPLKTPTVEDRPCLDLALNLPQSNASLPTPTVLRTGYNLRLPSFDVLGIAAPHPDRITQQAHQSFSPLGAGPLSKPEDPLHALSPPIDFFKQTDGPKKTPFASPKAASAQVGHIVATHTPPAESEPGSISWGSFVRLPAGLGSPPSSDPGVSPNLAVTAGAKTPGQAPIVVPTHEFSEAFRMAAWIEEAKNTIGEHLIRPSHCNPVLSSSSH